MTDNPQDDSKKTEELKKHMEKVESKVYNIIDHIENTSLGQKLPTKIENIKFSDIVEMLLILCIIYTGAIYSILQCKSYESGHMKWIWSVLKWGFLFIGVAGSIFDFFIYLLVYGELNVFSICLRILKMVTVAVFVVAAMLSGFLSNFIVIMVYIFMIALDLTVLYYMTIFFKRVQSDKYDNYGDLKEENKDGVKGEEKGEIN
ncbi:hypothetical protein DMUE_3330 [Dictyocoela muelleri]|nr:hypothetical protein DMUE_3330 [Dictyocoela muelleri]